MEDENYNLLLEEIAKRDTRIEELEKRVADVCNFNKTLLNQNSDTSTQNTSNRKDELKKKLEGGLRR